MSSPTLIRTRWLPLLLAWLLALAAVDAGAGDAGLTTKPGKYGKVLVADVVFSPSQLDQMSAFLDTLAATRQGKPNSAFDGDTWDWVGEPVDAKPSASPYSIVLEVRGRAKAAGDVLTTWKSGWRMDSGVTKQTVMPPGLAVFGAQTGDHVTLVSASAPSRLDVDKTLIPVLSLVDTRNLTIDGVHVQVWSGMAGMGLMDHLFAWRFLALGVVMVIIALVFKRI